jgi:ABC-type transport system substrate-binding protein
LIFIFVEVKIELNKVKRVFAVQDVHFGDVNYTEISNTQNFNENDCSMIRGCHKWETINFTYYNSIENESKYELPPVFGNRWNGIDWSWYEYLASNSCNILDFDVLTINRQYSTAQLLQLDLNPIGTIHVSILAHDSAQIVFTQDEDFKSGFMIVLGGWTSNQNRYSKSVVRYCPKITTNSYPQECTEFVYVVAVLICWWELHLNGSLQIF